MFRPRTLSAKLVTIFVSTIVAVFVVVFLLLQYSFYQNEKLNLRERLDRLTGVQAGAIEAALWEFDDAGIRDMLRQLAEVPEIHGAVVLDSGGQEVHKVGMDEGAHEHTLMFDRELVHVEAGRRETIGRFVVWGSDEQILATLRKRAIENALVLLAICLAMGITTWVVTRRVIGQPLAHLHEVSQRFAEGDLDARANLIRGDELGALSRALDNAAETVQRRDHDLGERIKELNCLFTLSEILDRADQSLEDTLHQAVHLLPPGWQFPEVTTGRITFRQQQYLTEPFEEGPWRQATEIVVNGVREGSVEVFYTDERPTADEGPFLREERALIEEFCRRIVAAIERRQAAEELKRINDELEQRVADRTAEVERSREGFRTLIESAPEAMIIVDRQGLITRVNRQAERLFKYQRDAMIGQTVEMLMPERAHEAHVRHRAAFLVAPERRDMGLRDANLVAADAEGREFPIEVSLSPIETGEGMLVAASVRDISEREKRETELRQLYTAMNQSPMAVMIADTEGTLEYVNPFFTEMTGYAAEEVIGRNPRFLSSGNTPRGTYDDMWATIRSGEQWRGELENQRKDGSELWVSITMSPIRTDDGKTTHILAIEEDITERRAAERAFTENRQLLQGIVENSSTVIYVKDREGRYELCNHAWEDATGVSRDVGIGKTDHEIMPEAAEHLRAADLEVMRTGELVEAEESVDGERYFLSVKFPIKAPSGEVIRVCGMSTDITQLKRLQADLEVARDEAEAATEAKANFLASMSHEIRTPMNGVIGMADLLAQTDLAEEQQQMLQTIRESGNSLITIINDILDFSKIEAGKLDIEAIPMNVADVVEGAVATLAPNAVRKGLSLVTFIDPGLPRSVLGDPVRLRQILFNLTGNAIKFSEQGAVQVRAELQSHSSDGDWVRFSIIDKGIGISEEAQARLFQAFTQAESSTTRKYGGTGLGLAICQRLAELMGGEIGVNSTLGEGSEFYVCLPMSATEKERGADKDRDLAGLKVLFVSPDQGLRDIGARYLGVWHAEVETTADLGGTVARAQQAEADGTPFDIIVLADDTAPDMAAEVRQAFLDAGKLPYPRFVVARNRLVGNDALEGLEEVTFLDTNPIRRAGLINAVAIASGRASPEVAAETPTDTAAKVKAPTVEEALAQGRLILLAEDNLTNQDVIRRQLNLLGYQCEIANDGKEAFAAWQAKPYAMLLTDCHMPNMDGFELTEAIRQSEKGADERSPIVAVTANALQGEAERCIAAGMDDYLSKPVEMPKLRAALEKWMPGGAPQAAPAETTKAQETQETIEADAVPANGGDAAVDPSILKEMFGDDDETVREILRDFVAPASDNVREIQDAFEQGSADGVGKAAHKLKSSARSVGANELADLCYALETAGKAGKFDEIESQMPRLPAVMQEVTAFIETM